MTARSRPAVALLALASALLVASCSSSPPPTVSADDAATAVAATFSLPDNEKDCLVAGFHDHPKAADALDPTVEPTEQQLEQLSDVNRACITPESLASSVTNSAAEGIGTVTADQRVCLHAAVLALSGDEQATMMTGLVAPNAQGTTKMGIELGRITSGLLDGCHVSVLGPTGSTPGVDPGATSVTR